MQEHQELTAEDFLVEERLRSLMYFPDGITPTGSFKVRTVHCQPTEVN